MFHNLVAEQIHGSISTMINTHYIQKFLNYQYCIEMHPMLIQCNDFTCILNLTRNTRMYCSQITLLNKCMGDLAGALDTCVCRCHRNTIKPSTGNNSL